MKTGFYFKGNNFVADGVPLEQIAAEHGTPLYVYSAAKLREKYRLLAKAFAKADVRIAYSVKSNSNLAVLSVLEKEGANFDIVSGGELARVQKIGIDPSRVIFAGVGKTEAEMRAALKAGVAEFNVESEGEAERLNMVAGSMKKKAPIAIRINPNVDAKTHKYITTGKAENKFGVSLERALALAKRIGTDLPHIELEGLHCHVGSQILDPAVHPKVVAVVSDFAKKVMKATGRQLHSINFGGGFGIPYKPEQEGFALEPFANAVIPAVKELGVSLLLEPGRYISGQAGVLLARVQYVKRGNKKTFVILDGSMTELIRPTLYESYHEIVAVKKKRGESANVDFVGPVCETGDFLALDREAIVPQQDDLIAVRDAGAYGFVMASHYNTRPNPAEVMVDGGKVRVVRKRETVADLFRLENA